MISANGADGVDITGADATGNTVLNNIIGLTSGGTTVLGNGLDGVFDSAPGTTIGPGNVISANLVGVLISGATATLVTVSGNLIGTDSSGEADLGNAEAGVEIEERDRRDRRRQRPRVAGHLGQPDRRRDQRFIFAQETWSRGTTSASTRRAPPTAATRTTAC